MNIGQRKNPVGSLDQRIDEHEWLAQERALREERAGAIAAGDDALLARYRQVARALRRPLPDALPADFARSVAMRVAHAGPDMRLEQQLLRVLSLLLAVSAIAALALYGGEWPRAFAAVILVYAPEGEGDGPASSAGEDFLRTNLPAIEAQLNTTREGG